MESAKRMKMTRRLLDVQIISPSPGSGLTFNPRLNLTWLLLILFVPPIRPLHISSYCHLSGSHSWCLEQHKESSALLVTFVVSVSLWLRVNGNIPPLSSWKAKRNPCTSPLSLKAMRKKKPFRYRVKIWEKAGREWIPCNSFTWKARAGGSLQVLDQPDLQNEFQTIQSYMAKRNPVSKGQQTIAAKRLHLLSSRACFWALNGFLRNSSFWVLRLKTVILGLFRSVPGMSWLSMPLVKISRKVISQVNSTSSHLSRREEAAHLKWAVHGN